MLRPSANGTVDCIADSHFSFYTFKHLDPDSFSNRTQPTFDPESQLEGRQRRRGRYGERDGAEGASSREKSSGRGEEEGRSTEES